MILDIVSTVVIQAKIFFCYNVPNHTQIDTVNCMCTEFYRCNALISILIAYDSTLFKKQGYHFSQYERVPPLFEKHMESDDTGKCFSACNTARKYYFHTKQGIIRKQSLVTGCLQYFKNIRPDEILQNHLPPHFLKKLEHLILRKMKPPCFEKQMKSYDTGKIFYVFNTVQKNISLKVASNTQSAIGYWICTEFYKHNALQNFSVLHEDTFSQKYSLHFSL